MDYITVVTPTYYVFADAINQYHGHGADLSNCDSDAGGFYTTLQDDIQWIGHHYHEDDNAVESDWNHITRADYESHNADFSYFSGHDDTRTIYF